MFPPCRVAKDDVSVPIDRLEVEKNYPTTGPSAAAGNDRPLKLLLFVIVFAFQLNSYYTDISIGGFTFGCLLNKPCPAHRCGPSSPPV